MTPYGRYDWTLMTGPAYPAFSKEAADALDAAWPHPRRRIRASPQAAQVEEALQAAYYFISDRGDEKDEGEREIMAKLANAIVRLREIMK